MGFGAGLSFSCLGFRASSLGYGFSRVVGLGLWVWDFLGLGFRVLGLRCHIRASLRRNKRLSLCTSLCLWSPNPKLPLWAIGPQGYLNLPLPGS